MFTGKSNFIHVYAGRPGSGKTTWAYKEIISALGDGNNLVVYIGTPESTNELAGQIKGLPGECYMNNEAYMAKAIGYAIDAANLDRELFPADDESRTAQEKRCQISIYIDQHYRFTDPCFPWMMLAAVKAGISVNIICQKFSQLSKGNENWFMDNCVCYVIQPGHGPHPIGMQKALADDF